MQGCGAFCVLYISVLCCSVTGQVTVSSRKAVTADPVLRRMHEEFKAVDSDFDFEAAILNFKAVDYENLTQEIASKISDLGPKDKIHLDKKDQNEEITRLLTAGEALLDTPNERLFKNYRRAIMEKEMAGYVSENSTNPSVEKSPAKKRVKRQGGKFQEAAKVDNMKMLRIYLTMFKNLWARSYVGGKHPLHKDVPKAACIQFKRRIMETFFPPIGSDRRGYS